MTERSSAPGYETTDVSPRLVAWTGFGLALLTALVAIGAGALVALFNSRDHTSILRTAVEHRQLIPPKPRLQADPAADAAAYTAKMNHDLAAYAWVDRKNGVAHIPIAEAMHRLVTQGWPHDTADTGIDPSPAPMIQEPSP
jgi:hypothetical protein